MERTNSLNQLIENFKNQFINCKTEEDVRIITNELIKELASIYNFTIDNSNHEVTSVHGGRADSIYTNVIFEYKAPKKFKSTKGIQEALFGRDDKDRGLKHYLINFSLDENIKENDSAFVDSLQKKIGIGFDGEKIIFSRFIESNIENNLFEEKKTSIFPNKINQNQKCDFDYQIEEDLLIGFKKLALMLRSTTKNKLSSKNLISVFGPKTDICQKSINHLYTLLEKDLLNNPRVSTLYFEWNRIFGDVYGETETEFTKFKKSLCDMYDVKIDIEVRKFLFVLQTYYNIVLKLLISHLIFSLQDPVKNMHYPKNKNELQSLFSGTYYVENKIENFFELHFFEWFIYTEKFELALIKEIAFNLETFETTMSVIKPELVEDVLREMYTELIPKDLRHMMGEFYTPGWLVEFTLDKIQFTGELQSTLLDPTCGSGSFITHAIKRVISSNLNEETEKIIQSVSQNIVGYDINPIAVISAKTNYILSLGDLSVLESPISIPVFMCDSVLVPTVHAKQIEKYSSIIVKTIVGDFNIPVFKNRIESDLFLKEVSKAIINDYSYEEFEKYNNNKKLFYFDENNKATIENFYNQLLSLHMSKKNGYWAIILKNSFAPLFAKEGFDYVVGNPPWISWKSMSDTYRKQTLNIWLSYGIFEKSAFDKITTHDDFAMAVTYVAIDHYCKKNSKVAFILPQTFLKSSKGGEGFRKFIISRDNININFSIDLVYDMVDIKPFRKFASNKPALIVFQKNKENKYPFKKYYICKKKSNNIINYEDSYQQALDKMYIIQEWAKPINSNDVRSPWLTLPAAEINSFDKFIGASPYKGRKGIEPCGAKGIYLLKIISSKGDNVRIENLIKRSRLQKAKDLGVKDGYVEKDLVYPMVGGRNISKWGINSYLYMLVPHYSSGKSLYKGIPEADLKINYDLTYKWLFYFKDLLLETRLRSGKFFKSGYKKGYFPFYRLDNIGDYTFYDYHLVWKEQNKTMVACVISKIQDEYLGNKVVVTDSKLLFYPTNNKDEAHYICAIINSPLITKVIESYTIDTQRGVDILKNIAIPEFNKLDKNHMSLVNLSIMAHDLFLKNKEIDSEGIKKIEAKIDKLVNKIFIY